MRSILVAGATVLSVLSASPAWSQNWSGSLPAVQNEERMLTFEVSGLDDLVAWNLYLAFSPSAFATPAITLSFQPGDFDFVDVGPPANPVAADFADPIPSDYLEIVAAASHLLPISVPGSLFTAQFNALPTALGSTQVFSRFYYVLDNGVDVVEQTIDLQPLTTNIAAVPEPQTWALMLVGVGAVLGWAARRRNAAA
jgi:hypothetical protein